MSDFDTWWTSGDPTGPGADLALASPLARNARQAFDAGRAAERQRIRQLAIDHCGHCRRILGDLLGDDDDN